MKMYPVMIEGYESDDCLFRVKAVDNEACEVTINTPVDSRSWTHIAAAVQIALANAEVGWDVPDMDDAP